MRGLAFIVAAFVAVVSTYGQEVDLAVSNIPEELLKDAVAVIRYENRVLEVEDDANAVLKVDYAVTVLNENGASEGNVVMSYNKDRKVSKIEITLIDEDGKKIERVKAGDIVDVSNISSASLFDESRVKYYTPVINDYPYTVCCSYEYKYDGILSYPDWNLISNYNVSFEGGSYRIEVKDGAVDVRYKGTGVSIEPTVERIRSEGNVYDLYEWKSGSLPAIKPESYAKHPSNFFPAIEVSPVQINYAGYSGSLDTWKSFGEWQWNLINGTETFSPETEAEIRSLVENCSSDREKVETLYKYMQDKVRYVNLTIGQTGLVPIDAQRVHDVSYGDCKALSNYMRALLKAAGIEAHYTKVFAGSKDRQVDVDFPSQQSNHIILMVPMQNDSIWLECTSQRSPVGFLGDFTDDRTVLFVTEEGGILGKTPSYSMKENCVYSKTHIDIDENLDAKIVRDKKYGGTFFDDAYNSYLYRDDEEKKKAIIGSLSLSDFSLDSYSYDYDLEGKPHICQHVKITDDMVVTKNGDYYTIPFNLVNYRPGVPTRVRNRQQEVYLKRSKYFSDSISIRIPEGYAAFELPEKKEIVSQFGKYVSSVEKTAEGILYLREIEFYKGTFPAEEYRDFYQFYRDISKAADQMLVMVKVP